MATMVRAVITRFRELPPVAVWLIITMSWWRLEPNQPTIPLRRRAEAVVTSATQGLQEGGRASRIDGMRCDPWSVMVM